MNKIGIVNVNLQYMIPVGQDPKMFLENVELPKEYVEDSFEIVKILDVDDIGLRG
jgi:hypothetical protein